MTELKLIALIAGIGAILGIGQLLASTDRVTLRLAIGRAIVSGGLGLTAGSLLLLMPEIPLVALVGVSCVVVSLGTSALETLFQRIVAKKL
jgi:hypothetical protein